MPTMQRIDLHVHIYPQKIAQHAADAIGAFYDGAPMRYDGTVETLLPALDEARIDRAVVHSVAMSPARVRTINDFIAGEAAKHPDRLIGFATLHPDMDDPAAEVARARALGLRGVKIHSDMQQIAVDDPRMEKIYAACEGAFPLLLHAGDYRFHFDNPSQIARAAKQHPGLTFIAAHLGGYTEWDEAAKCLPGIPNVLVDTSSSFFALGYDKMRALIDLYGEDNVLYGTDYPMWSPAEEIAVVERLGLSDTALAKILGGNAARLLKL